MAKVYTLVIEVDDASAGVLARAGACIIVAKPAANSPPNVAWLALNPTVRSVISWDETFGVYASQSPIRAGATIDVVSAVFPAEDGKVHAFENGGFRLPAAAARIPRGHYDVMNEAPYPATFGLLQDASVDGRQVRSPLNAVVLPPTFTADFSDTAKVYVWSQTAIPAGTIVAEVPAEATVVTFALGEAVKRCRYDADGRRFAERDGMRYSPR